MKMRKFLLIPAAVVAMLATACSSEDNIVVEQSAGTAEFAIGVSANVTDVVTRANEGTLDASLLPDETAFKLEITGTYTEKDENDQEIQKTYNNGKWNSLSDYYKEKVKLNKGTYTATITAGNPAEEGIGKPYFVGVNENFTVKANTVQTYEIEAKLANSCFTFAVTDWMLNYYKDIVLNIHTATNTFTFNPTSIIPSDLYFVAADQVLSISGTAVKAQTGTPVEFPKTNIGVLDSENNVVDKTLAAQHRYAIVVDNSAVGSGNLTVKFDDTFTEVPAVEVELNPDVEEE